MTGSLDRETVMPGTADRFDAFSLRSRRVETFVSMGLAGFFLALAAVATLFPYSETIEARGQVMPDGGVIRIASDRSGIIQSFASRENVAVKEGDVVAVIRSDLQGAESTSHARATIENLNSQIRAIEARSDAETGMVRSQLAHLATERREMAERQDRARANLDLAKRKVELASESFERAQRLAEVQLISKLELGRLEEQLLNAKIALTAAEQSAADAEEGIHDVQERINQAQAQLVSYEQQKLVEVNRIRQQILDSRYSESSEVLAPVAGTLTYANFREGESIRQGDVLAFVVPAGATLRAVAYVPSRFVANLAVGQDVKVTVDSHPYQRYGVIRGTLAEVSLAPVEPTKEVQQQPTAGSVYYRVVVNLEEEAFDGKPITSTLKPGELLSVSISSDSKPVYRWIIDYIRWASRGAP